MPARAFSNPGCWANGVQAWPKINDCRAGRLAVPGLALNRAPAETASTAPQSVPFVNARPPASELHQSAVRIPCADLVTAGGTRREFDGPGFSGPRLAAGDQAFVQS